MNFNITNVGNDPLTYVLHTKFSNTVKHLNDLWLEFGVFRGSTINNMSNYTKDTVYGFDSFEGLPEFWREGFDAGAFNLEGQLPSVNSNVELIKGWFTETLPKSSIKFEWIGMNGKIGDVGGIHERVALKIV